MNFQKHHPVRALLNANRFRAWHIKNALDLCVGGKNPTSQRGLAVKLGTLSKPQLAQIAAHCS